MGVCVSDLLILYLQRRQAGLELREAQGELSLDLRLGGNLGHLTGSGTRTGQSGSHTPERPKLKCVLMSTWWSLIHFNSSVRIPVSDYSTTS